MAYCPSDTGSESAPSMGGKTPTMPGGRKLFAKKSPGAPGKLGKSSTKAESLSKLRGKGALA